MAITVQQPTNTYAPPKKTPAQSDTDALTAAFTGADAPSGVPAPSAAANPQSGADTGVPSPTPARTPTPAPVQDAPPSTGQMPPAGLDAAQAAPQTYDPNQALAQVASRFQARFGRAMTADEQQQLIAAIGYQSGPVSDTQLQHALSLVDSYNAGGPTEGTQPVPSTPGLEGTQPVPAGGLDPNQALTQVQAAFRARFGRTMTPQEQQQLIAAIGYQSGNVTDAQMQQALALVASYNPTGGPGGPGLEGTQPVPNQTGIDPNQALAQVRAAFRQRFGRDLTPQEQAWIIQMSGYGGSGNVTDAQLAAAMDAIARYTGNMGNPFDRPRPISPEEEEANRRLRELLGEHWGDVDPNNPAMRAQRDAHQLQTQRAATRKRAALAERAAARGGLASGGYDVDTERILQEQGESDQGFEADLMANELRDQRQRLMQGIDLAKRYGLQSEAQRLQEKLGTLDIELRRYLGQGQLGLGLLGLGQNDQHFYDTLGQQLLELMLRYNQNGVNATLGA